MEMNQIRYFLALCEEKQFTRAAATCGVAQPSLTTAIKKLEQELGGTLFDRKRGEPTELGELVKPFLQRIARNAAAAKWCARRVTGAPAQVNGTAASLAFAGDADADADDVVHAVRPEPAQWATVERVLP